MRTALIGCGRIGRVWSMPSRPWLARVCDAVEAGSLCAVSGYLVRGARRLASRSSGISMVRLPSLQLVSDCCRGLDSLFAYAMAHSKAELSRSW